ncbi:hypothetical protein KFK09_018893 [Dendrobium nobile]|uniref:Uncharacterized protein n=1 Tax=Dendrobium nobile TaxID=94219 RepID=A0A8T3AX21_DENNO|nr:hypothetical protein KFK09_018893 [Dendrobium nobile]
MMRAIENVTFLAFDFSFLVSCSCARSNVLRKTDAVEEKDDLMPDSPFRLVKLDQNRLAR